MRADYVTTTYGMRGFFAVLITHTEEGYPEPAQTGVGSYPTQEEAEAEALEWADSEGLEYEP